MAHIFLPPPEGTELEIVLHVLIERQLPGYLRAWVTQEGQKGCGLLKGNIKDVDKAKTIIKDRLEKDAPGCKLKWTVRNAAKQSPEEPPHA